MKKTYYELRISPSGAYSLFVDFIFSLGYEAVEERDSQIIVRSEESVDVLMFALEEYAKKLSETLNSKISLQMSLEEKENIDWVLKYQKSIEPISVGKFYIRPSWIEKKEGYINLIIDPALAFGSGHHETTSSCINMLEKYIKKGDTLLDVGCGSGILSIAAYKLGAKVDICDTDELAIKSAKENFNLNSAKYRKVWVGSVNKREKTYDIVIANIIADILIMLSNDLKESVKEDGILILSGILDKYLDKVTEKFKSSMTLLEKYKKNEWYTLVLKR